MSRVIKKEWVTEAGLNAYVLYVDNSHHCGYVAVPEKYIGDNYDEHYDIDVHGGLTFASTIIDIDEKWLFGFDAAHSGDKTAYINRPGDTFKDVDYMANECEKLAKQLKELK